MTKHKLFGFLGLSFVWAVQFLIIIWVVVGWHI
jgi:hypothetical protein